MVDADDTIFCEYCSLPILGVDPGHWWEVDTSKYPKTVTVPLHDEDCRHNWFMEQPLIRRYIKDAEIGWRD